MRIYFEEKALLEIIGTSGPDIYSRSPKNLESRVQKLIQTNTPHLLCLDMHGVADLFQANETFSHVPETEIWIISFIGPNSIRLPELRTELLNRIKQKQIHGAILVFQRGKMATVGTKAWVIQCLNSPTTKSIIFLDDGVDHIAAVQSLGLKTLTTHYIAGKDDIKKRNQICQILSGKKLETFQKV